MFHAADVLDEGSEVGFVIRIHAAVLVVPALVPAEAGDLDALLLVVREVGVDVLGHFFHDAQDLVVVKTGIAGHERLGIFADARRQEIVADTLAAPASLDHEHLLLVMVANLVTEADFRPHLAATRTVARHHAAELGLPGRLIEKGPDILAFHPLPLLVDEELILLRVVLDDTAERTAVIAFNASFALHVGLPGHDVDLHRRFCLSIKQQRGRQDRQAVTQIQSRFCHDSRFLRWK